MERTIIDKRSVNIPPMPLEKEYTEPKQEKSFVIGYETVVKLYMCKCNNCNGQ